MPSKHKKVYHKSKKDKTFHIKQLEKWEHTIQKQLPTLTKSQAYTLALWSFAMIIIKSCVITSVSFFLAFLFEKDDSLAHGSDLGNRKYVIIVIINILANSNNMSIYIMKNQ